MLRSLLARSQQQDLRQLPGILHLQSWISMGLNSWDAAGMAAKAPDLTIASRRQHYCGWTCSKSSSSSQQSLLQGQHQQNHWKLHQQQFLQLVQPAAVSQLHLRLNSSSAVSQQQQQQQYLERRRDAMKSKIVKHEYTSPTLGIVSDAYVRPASLLQAGVLPHPVKTFSFYRQKVKNWVSRRMAMTSARVNIPGFDKHLLPHTVADMYYRINKAQAEFKLDPIKDLLSRSVYLKLRAQGEQRKMGHWDRIVWDLQDRDELKDNIKYVHARMVKTDKDSPFEWIQFTFCIRSKQKFAAYRHYNQAKHPGKQEELVAGNPDEWVDVEDYWVFEHKTRVPIDKQKVPVAGARWRMIARLSL